MTSKGIFYFAYGSNLNQRQMRERCPESSLVGRAHIKGYRLDFTISSPVRWHGGGCADIVADAGSVVWGLMYKLSDRDLERLDQSEGSRYRRFVISTVSDDGGITDAYVYEVIDKAPFQQPAKAYLDIIKNAARDVNFPEAYRAFLDAIPTQD